MTLSSLTALIVGDLTYSAALPQLISTEEIQRVITQRALPWFKANRTKELLANRLYSIVDNNSVVIKTTLVDEDIYATDSFQRYAISLCKKSLGSFLCSYAHSLPGEVTLNGELLKEEAEREQFNFEHASMNPSLAKLWSLVIAAAVTGNIK